MLHTLTLLLALATPAPLQATDPVVSLEAGEVRGVDTGEILSFLGLPFAAPPVGNLRWCPPQPVAPWEGVRAADAFAPMCPQPDAGTRRFDGIESSEDCLYLNVYVPDRPAPEGGWPVMVWIHGGAFALGTASSELYDGKRLAEQGVMVVTTNYRLGIFGFFAHPALTAEGEGTSGNYGLLDQLAALRWVQANAAAFGGDADNVTIFGESAGAVSVNHLLVMPGAEGLFHRAILESGHAMMTRRDLRKDHTEVSGHRQGEQLAARLGVPSESDPKETLAALRAIPAEALVEQTGLVVGGGGEAGNDQKFWPLVDGVHVPAEPAELMKSGAVHRVPVILGTNANEGSVLMRGVPFVTRKLYREMLDKAYGQGAERVEAMFPVRGVGAKDVAEHVSGLAGFVAPARRVARWLEANEQPVYLYHFTRVPPALERFGKQADHGAEIPYVFGHTTEGKLAKLYAERDDELSAEMMQAWAAFARTGSPGLNWPRYTAEEDRHMEFGTTTQAGQHLYKAACDLFDELDAESEGPTRLEPAPGAKPGR